MQKNTYLKLIKPVDMPGQFHLAGAINTLEQWEKLFGELDSYDIEDWFEEVVEESVKNETLSDAQV